jgi:exonuclease I
MVEHDNSNDKHIYVANLAVDPRTLAGLSEPALRLRVGERPRPIRRLRANAAPILSRIQTEQATRLPRPLGRGSTNCIAVRRSSNLIRACVRGLIAAFEANREPREPSRNVKEQSYDAFFTDADHRLMTSVSRCGLAGSATHHRAVRGRAASIASSIASGLICSTTRRAEGTMIRSLTDWWASTTIAAG